MENTFDVVVIGGGHAGIEAAHASASVSSIRFANSGGVKTSSFERLAMQLRTSGFRPRSAKPCLPSWTAAVCYPPHSTRWRNLAPNRVGDKA